jgi:hypothetical protein
VHVASDTPFGSYALEPLRARPDAAVMTAVTSVTSGAPGEAPNATVLVSVFAHAAHASFDPHGALVVVFEGTQRIPDAQQKRCG